MQIKFHKVTSLPGTLEANALYFVLNNHPVAGQFSETYVTDSTGTARALGNSAVINALANNAVTTALADYNLVEIVADIAARDAYASGKTRNLMVLVQDASGDPTVSGGAALYAYRESDTSWTKLSEFESMDVSLEWGNISGRPTSSVATIDDAVNKRHAHANASVLNLLGESAGALTYNGAPVASEETWDSVNW